MGFEDRRFPPLQPLYTTNANSHGSLSSAGVTTTHTFVDWAQQAGGRLPVLASQWSPEEHRCWGS